MKNTLKECMVKAIKNLKKVSSLNCMVVLNIALKRILLKKNPNWKKERLKEKYQVETMDDQNKVQKNP